MLGRDRVPGALERENAGPSVRSLLIAGTITLFAARFAFSLLRSGPVVVADEIGYLTNARVLSGGIPGQLYHAPFYHGGYSLLLAPLLAARADPGRSYHLVLALNAVLAACLFPLLHSLLVRFAGFSRQAALGPAFAGAVYPSVTVLSQVAMSENALYPLTCVWLIALCGLLEAQRPRGRLPWAVAAGISAATLYAVHGRMIAAVIVTAAAVAWSGVRRRLEPGAAIAALGALGAGLVGTHFLHSYLVTHNYGGHAPNEFSVRLFPLLHPGGIVTAAGNVVGQTWALVVVTFGLAAVVVAELVLRLRDSRGGGGDGPRRVLPIVLSLTGLLVLVSAASFPNRTRSDMLIYGRYAEVTAPALIALGVAILARRRRWPRIGSPWLGLAVLTAAVVAIRAGSGSLHNPNRWNVASLPFVTSNLGVLVLVGAAVVAGAGAWLLSAVSARRAGAVWVVAVALFLPTIAYGVRYTVLEAEDGVYPSGWTSPQHAADAAGVRQLAYDLDLCAGGRGYTFGGRYVIQWFLPHTRVLVFHAGRQPPPSRDVLSDSAWASQRRIEHAVRIWTGPAAGCGEAYVLWRRSAA